MTNGRERGCRQGPQFKTREQNPRPKQKAPDLVKDQGLCVLVAWDGIEPSTRGFSMGIRVREGPILKRNSEQNQALAAQSTAVDRCHTHSSSNAPSRKLPRFLAQRSETCTFADSVATGPSRASHPRWLARSAVPRSSWARAVSRRRLVRAHVDAPTSDGVRESRSDGPGHAATHASMVAAMPACIERQPRSPRDRRLRPTGRPKE